MSRNSTAASYLASAAFWLSGSSAVAILFSIAASQILLGLAFATLLMSGEKLRLPAIRLPLALFMAGTLISLALSGDARAGLPQIRKFFVFLMLLVVYSTFREVAQARRLVLCWIAVGAVVAGRGLVQFGEKLRDARLLGQDFYEYYVPERITGFMGHWMTFGGELMVVILLLAAFLFFSPSARRKILWLCLLSGVLLSAALLLSYTRAIWLATGAAALYLIWNWRRWLVLAAPVLLVAGVWLAPYSVRSRVVSIFHPRRETDSNQHRIVCWRTGWQMIRAHPWFGLGPEQVRIQFDRYVPPDVPRPLPNGWYGHLHNIYIHYAAERGVPTMLVLVWLLIKILLDFLRTLRKLPPGPSDEKFLLYGSVAVVVAIMIAGVFELNLGDSEVLTMFLVTVACGYVARDSVIAKAESVA